MLKGKATIILLTLELIKKMHSMSKYFPEQKSSGGRVLRLTL